MKNASQKQSGSLKSALKLTSVLALAVFVSVASSNPAQAYDRGWDRHEHEARRWRHAHHAYEPGYVEAPPVVYAAPPPQPSGINFIIPLHIH